VRLISKPFEAAPELFEDAGAPKLAAVQTAVRKSTHSFLSISPKLSYLSAQSTKTCARRYNSRSAISRAGRFWSS